MHSRRAAPAAVHTGPVQPLPLPWPPHLETPLPVHRCTVARGSRALVLGSCSRPIKIAAAQGCHAVVWMQWRGRIEVVPARKAGPLLHQPCVADVTFCPPAPAGARSARLPSCFDCCQPDQHVMLPQHGTRICCAAVPADLAAIHVCLSRVWPFWFELALPSAAFCLLLRPVRLQWQADTTCRRLQHAATGCYAARAGRQDQPTPRCCPARVTQAMWRPAC